jgi:flagellar hook-basal body complex protein FliE
MNIEALQALGGHDEVAPLAGGPAAAPVPGTQGRTFSSRVLEGLQELNGQLAASQVDLQRLATGDVQNLHDVMVRLEESRIALQLTLQVRNRVLEAYQDVMRMQI